MDVGEWLRHLGLGQYEAAFCENEVDADVLHQLTAEDLKELGVAAVGHRRRLLAAIAKLQAETVVQPPAEPIGEVRREPRQVLHDAREGPVGEGNLMRTVGSGKLPACMERAAAA